VAEEVKRHKWNVVELNERPKVGSCEGGECAANTGCDDDDAGLDRAAIEGGNQEAPSKTLYRPIDNIATSALFAFNPLPRATAAQSKMAH
jgi:hypothetical protein